MKMCLISWHLCETSLIKIRKHGGHSNQATQSTHFSDRADSPQGEDEVIYPLYPLAELELGGENLDVPSDNLPLCSLRSRLTNRSSIYFPIDFHETHVTLSCCFL